MEERESVTTWFKREIMCWRIIGCCAYSVALQIFLSVAIIFLLNADFLSPLRWLKDGSFSVLSLATFGYCILLSAVTMCLVFSYAAQFKMHPVMFSTVLERIIHVINPWRILTVAGYVVTAGFMAAVYLRIAASPYATVSVSCDVSRRCVNRPHVLLICSACFVGLLYGMGLIGGDHGCVRFPIIQRKRSVQVKSAMSAKVSESFREVLSNLKWFLLTYSLICVQIDSMLANSLGWNNGASSFFATLYDLLDVKLWWSLLLVNTTVHLLFSSVAFFIAVFLTEKLSFAVESPFESEACRLLNNGLNCVDCPLLSHLTFLDLSLSSQQSASKRKDIFSLSQPGGHPRQWNTIVESGLRLIRGLTEEITIFCEPPSKPLLLPKQAIGIGETFASQSSSDVAYEMWRLQRFTYLNTPNQSTGNSAMLQSALKSPPDVVTSSKLFLSKKLEDLRKYFRNIPMVAYFVRESVETSVSKIFISCQLHIWAIEALSFLVAASLEEDKYGVVQKDLSTILVCLLDLQQALNRLQKFELALGPARRNSKTRDSWPDQLKGSLKFAVKSALYRIVTTFGSHLNAVTLSNEHRRHLNQYLTFQE